MFFRMNRLWARWPAGALATVLLASSVASAQTANPAEAPATTGPNICGVPVPPPANLPPDDSGPVVYFMGICFDKQGGSSTGAVENETYLYYIHLRPSLASQNQWVPFDEEARNTIVADFTRLWDTNFLDDLSVESEDYTFANGVVGKLLTYHMEERERIKIVDYDGSDQVERTKIDEQLQAMGISLRLDSFRDDATIRRVEGVIRSFMADKGYNDTEVTHSVTPVAGGPKLINVTFHVNEGPKIKIKRINFIGNTAVSDRALRKQIKANKAQGMFSLFTRRGTYKADRYEEDAERVGQYYRNNGYIQARIGAPEITVLRDSKDKKTRWVELGIPVHEGPRFRVGDFDFAGNTVVKGELLRPYFDLDRGDIYDEEVIRKGLESAREIYGSVGYWEFTGYPDQIPRASVVGNEPGQVPLALAATLPSSDGTVDVTIRLQEGEQYFVNRITFVGNTTTRDNVIRREMQLGEGGVFNSESLKYSVRRLNQLGYFKQLEEQEAVEVTKVADKENVVDLKLRLEEQNRNQISFGAGVSQFEGFFGQLSFQTANFLGRGESLTVSMQAGSRSQNYQLGFTEPFLFDRNMTAGFDIYKRTLQYIGQFTQASTGGSTTFGLPMGAFSRMFLNYSLENVRVRDLNEAFFDSSCLFLERGCAEVSLTDLSASQALLVQQNPFLFDSLLIGQSGKRTVSKITPSFVHNTVDNPIFPNRGKRFTLSLDVAGVGGNTKYLRPRIEAVWFKKHFARTSFGLRGQVEYIRPYGGSTLPIFEKLYLGGEYTIRGYDIRTIGPSDPTNRGLVLGGNKSILFNAEYLISIAGPVRLILFYDAGQVRDIGERFSMKEDLTETEVLDAPLLRDPFAQVQLVDPNASSRTNTVVVGQTSAFKTSTGAEIRFFMPVLNVPFRLIFAANPQRGNVLDNRLLPVKNFTFKFAVGSTF
jgi:outer membrane protein insertion porin family